MLHADIWEKAYKLKVFQIWELTEEVYKDWEGIFSKKVVKDRVTSFVASQIKANALIKVNKRPPVFAFPEFADEWKKYISFNTCPVCGSSFLPQNPQEIYCSKKCANKEYAKRKWKKVKPPTRQNKPWTDKEILLLKKEIRRKGRLTAKDLRELAQKLGRSFKSVMHKYYEVRKDEIKNHS